MKPGNHQRSKQRCQDLGWKVHDGAQSFVLSSYTMHVFVMVNIHSNILLVPFKFSLNFCFPSGIYSWL